MAYFLETININATWYVINYLYAKFQQNLSAGNISDDFPYTSLQGRTTDEDLEGFVNEHVEMDTSDFMLERYSCGQINTPPRGYKDLVVGIRNVVGNKNMKGGRPVGEYIYTM